MRVHLTTQHGQPHYTLTTTAAGTHLARTGGLPQLLAPEQLGAALDTIATRTSLVALLPNLAPPATREEATTLLELDQRFPLHRTDHSQPGEAMHLTLAYAFPLHLEPRWRTWAHQHLDTLCAGRQLVTVRAADLVAAHPVPHARPSRSRRRLLRTLAATTVTEHTDLDGFLRTWTAFTTDRFQPPTAAQLAALRAIFTATGCTVRDFCRDGHPIARSLICRHHASRILFDITATWEAAHARLRPGILSALYNLTDAHTSRWRLSLCYGQFAYKDEVLADSPRLSLDDLLSARPRPQEP